MQEYSNSTNPQLQMQTETLELWIYSKTSGMTRMVSPSDYTFYLDRDYSDEMHGVFHLLWPEMQTETPELSIYSKTSGMTRMATSTSEKEVLQDLLQLKLNIT